ncbi:bifunctional diaminohydroxyphosphoribosylaminopyrimidine deaminase/5-amino-6-(5-phosphoribosylamino)uracil reductase RibD [Corynebacterium aquilae]|uniref:bifunctional diaminohydroxyphosphoribosylaminopyrimidine deaminase/5-amino-6-(5-phosphoribosylamino)uracil reductase RibD n=1 Tax=Corynebacterium aquilae TaxID=203263 RepID=UPI0009517321|nr:bifunctional diaminohydroxyphosphoribosylaminopyrimidine deaminase/5-amino-6-(5-phosphoribosylamino)uracil reductase RibD [Corynebacterium aquilae]
MIQRGAVPRCTAQDWLADPAHTRAWHCALEQGLRAVGSTRPNPPVGAVIISPNGQVCGQGHTQPPGSAHAEIMALHQAGTAARGATAVVTLEPCNHTGRTGPCSKALIDAGVARVVIGTTDPNPHAAGGISSLIAAGIEVIVLDIVSEALRPWLHWVTTGRPWVTWKVAHTLDGFIAAEDGTSQWITSEQARAAAHVDRAHRDAIVVGTGTVLADNPRLTARDTDGSLLERQPEPIVIGGRPIPDSFHLATRGVRQFSSIEQAWEYLGAQGHANVLVEGGAGLAHSLLSQAMVDEIHAYIAPKILGKGTPMIGGVVGSTLSDAQQFEIVETTPLGPDLRLVLRRQ